MHPIDEDFVQSPKALRSPCPILPETQADAWLRTLPERTSRDFATALLQCSFGAHVTYSRRELANQTALTAASTGGLTVQNCLPQ